MKVGDLVRVLNIPHLDPRGHIWVMERLQQGPSYGVITNSDRSGGYSWQINWFPDTGRYPFWGVNTRDIEPAGEDTPPEVWAKLARLKLEGKL